VRYAWIETQRDSYPLKLLCRVLQVSRSGYYIWRRRKPSTRVQRREQIGQAAQGPVHYAEWTDPGPACQRFVGVDAPTARRHCRHQGKPTVRMITMTVVTDRWV